MSYPSKKEVKAAKRAGRSNARPWVRSFGRQFDGTQQAEILAKGEAMDDIHADAIGAFLGIGEGKITQK